MSSISEIPVDLISSQVECEDHRLDQARDSTFQEEMKEVALESMPKSHACRFCASVLPSSEFKFCPMCGSQQHSSAQSEQRAVSSDSSDSALSMKESQLQKDLVLSSSAEALVSASKLKRQYMCSYCNKPFTTSSNRSRHERVVHGAQSNRAQDPSQLTCVLCCRIFATAYQLKEHASRCRGDNCRGGKKDSESDVESKRCLSPSLSDTTTSRSSPSSTPTLNDQTSQSDVLIHLSSTIDKNTKQVKNRESTKSNRQQYPSSASLESTLHGSGNISDPQSAVSKSIARHKRLPVSFDWSTDESDSDGSHHSTSKSNGLRRKRSKAEDSDFVPDSDDDSTASSESDSASDSESTNTAMTNREWSAIASKLINNELLDSVCSQFLDWLSQPPATPSDALVKQRRVTTDSQLYPIKTNLKFILGLILHSELCEVKRLRLAIFTNLGTCQQFHGLIVERQVGSARIHAIFLLIKKVLVWLSSTQSLRSRQYIPPQTFPSFQFVDSICHDAGMKRKKEARNRHLLTDPWLAPTLISQRAIPGSQSSNVDGGRKRKVKVNVENKSRDSVSEQRASTPPSTIASKEELSRIAKGAMAFLLSIQQAPDPMRLISKRGEALRYARYLTTATLVLALAPRSQVLRQLRVGTTFVWEQDHYWIKIPAEGSKNGKPVLLKIPEELTQPYKFYLDVVRPVILQAQDKTISGKDHGFVFTHAQGKGSRKEFSTWTKTTTQELIGRPLNAHTFRHSIITAYYDSGASEGELFQLAQLMNHDSATQRNYYVRPKWSQAVEHANSKLSTMLLGTNSSPIPKTSRLVHEDVSVDSFIVDNSESSITLSESSDEKKSERILSEQDVELDKRSGQLENCSPKVKRRKLINGWRPPDAESHLIGTIAI